MILVIAPCNFSEERYPSDEGANGLPLHVRGKSIGCSPNGDIYVAFGQKRHRGLSHSSLSHASFIFLFGLS